MENVSSQEEVKEVIQEEKVIPPEEIPQSEPEDIPLDPPHKDDLSEKIKKSLEQQNEINAKLTKTLEELTKKNEDLNKQLESIQMRVEEVTPTVIGAFDYEAASNLLTKQRFEDEEKQMRSDYDMIRNIFKKM